MISIIIPVYNVGKYLDQCLSSVSRQTYADFECILIDDGSTDESTGICDQWAEKDQRIRVIHKKNEGVSAARNLGIDVAKGEKILFVDSDDWLDEEYVELMVKHSEEADLAVSGIIYEYGNGNKKILQPYDTRLFPLGSENSSHFTNLCEKGLLYGPVEKLYLRSIIEKNNIRFPVGCSYGEDLLFNFKYLEHVKTISTINSAHYHYRITSNTLSSRFRANKFDEDYQQWRVYFSFFQNHHLLNETSNQFLYQRLWGIVYDGLFQYPKQNDSAYSYIKHILTIPEIDTLKEYVYEFRCAPWIKWLICHRHALAFYIYFKLSRKN